MTRPNESCHDKVLKHVADHFPERFRRQVQALFDRGHHSISPEVWYFPEE